MIRVRYNQNTTLVNGNFPNKINYPNIVIDEVNKTLTNSEGTFPFIEIEDNEQIVDKTMCVKDGVYQEFVKPDSELLQEAKDSKMAQIKGNREAFIYLPVDYNGSTFVNSEIASTNLQGAFTFAEEPIEWLDIDGNTVILTKLQMKDLANIMIAHRSTGYFLEASLINQVKACTTLTEVNNIDITFI